MNNADGSSSSSVRTIDWSLRSSDAFEFMRQNMTQHTLAERADVSRVTVARMEANGEAALLTNFLSVLAALRRTGDLEGLLARPVAETIDQFVGAQPARQRGSR